MARSKQRRGALPKRRARGGAYPIRPAWQERVLKELDLRGWSEKDFAKKVGCAQSTMHDTLKNPDAKHSSLVPMIHAAFGWDPPPDPNPPAAEPEPSPLLPSADALEMAAMYDQLSEAMKQKLRDDAAFYLSISKSTPERDPDTEN